MKVEQEEVEEDIDFDQVIKELEQMEEIEGGEDGDWVDSVVGLGLILFGVTFVTVYATLLSKATLYLVDKI